MRAMHKVNVNWNYSGCHNKASGVLRLIAPARYSQLS